MTTLEYAYGIPFVELPRYKVKPPVGNAPVAKRDTINYELMDEIFEFIKAHPGTWRQESWYKYVDPKDGLPKYIVKEEDVTEANSCGTSFCFAGHVAIHEGFPSPPKNADSWWNRKVLVDSDFGPHTESEEASEFAEKVLGLRPDQADVLFGPNNTIEDLGNIIAIFKEEPEMPGYVIEEEFLEEDVYDRPSVEEFLKRYREYQAA